MPEDRLKAIWPGALFMAPVSVLGYGLTTEYVRGTAGIIINLFLLLLNGVAVSPVYYITFVHLNLIIPDSSYR